MAERKYGFTFCSKVKEEAKHKFASYELTDELLDQYLDAFSCFDQNGDGRITPKDLYKLFLNLKLTISSTSIDKIFKQADKNKDGAIDFLEFVLIMLIKSKDEIQITDEELRELFDAFDTDKSGQISSKELKTAFGQIGLQLTDDEVKALIQAADQDGDANIDFIEFKTLIRSLERK